MSAITDISWADATWPITVGCDKVSAGCYDCYAMRDARRMGKNPNSKISAVYNGLVVQQGNGLLNWTGTVRELPERLDWPARWREHRDVFVCSQSDLFHEGISDEFIGRVFSVMRENAQHTYYVLTKRPERLLQLLSHTTPVEGMEDFSTHFPNVLVGISAEDQKAANARMPLLLQVPLDPTQRFVSAEPLIGSLDLSQWIHEIGWVIGGGESGRHAKPMHPAWPRLLRDQCEEAGIDFHFKQWGEWTSFPPSVETETVLLDGGSGILYHAKTRTTKAKLPSMTTTLNGMMFSRWGRKRTGRVLDGMYWNARPGRDNSTPLCAVHPLGTSVTINESAGPDYNGTQGVITTIQSDDQQPLEELDGEEVTYYITANGRELVQAFGYWQLSPEEGTQNNISQTSSLLVDQLLVAYHQEHPFLDKPEHTQEQGLRTELYYKDAVIYSQTCCEWVQKQMQEQGISIHIYRVSRGRILQDGCVYDLVVDNQEVLHEVDFTAVENYVLLTMENHDLYCEHHMTHPESGQSLRKAHNNMEAKYAEDGTSTPQYSYGPGHFTSEPRMELADDTLVQDALRELIEERGYRDATDLLRDFSLRNGETYTYFCTLQAPDGSPIYCRTPKKVLRVLAKARANNETNASRTAPEPRDSPPWTLVGNFESDDQEE